MKVINSMNVASSLNALCIMNPLQEGSELVSPLFI